MMHSAFVFYCILFFPCVYGLTCIQSEGLYEERTSVQCDTYCFTDLVVSDERFEVLKRGCARQYTFSEKMTVLAKFYLWILSECEHGTGSIFVEGDSGVFERICCNENQCNRVQHDNMIS